MKLILQSHDRFDDIGEFETDTQRIHIRTKLHDSMEWSGGPSGFYALIGGNFAVLFRLDHDLFFSYGGELFPITEDTHATVQGGEIRRRFFLTKGGRQVFALDYDISRSSIDPEIDFTQTEPEDFDFLLFVRNLLETPQRRRFARGFPID